MPDLPGSTLPADTPSVRPMLPLQGLTLLMVDDSRFASEALRLLCQRSGARLRRADTLEAATRHLSVYRPDVVIVDLGLPDGDGADLIRTLARDRRARVLGTSGDPAGQSIALGAGAAGFLPKPPDSLAAFQAAILQLLSGATPPPAPVDAPMTFPDPLALHDDLAHAAVLLSRPQDAASRRYVAAFVGSLAHSARDAILARAADRARSSDADLARLRALVSDRLGSAPSAFPRRLGAGRAEPLLPRAPQ